MAIQDIINDVRQRVETRGKRYQDAFNAYLEANKKAFNVVSNNAQSLANTEIGAAKNLYSAAQASFEKARKDGVRKVANKPAAYVPEGRDQLVAAYKQTIELLVKTGNELSDIVSDGYKTVVSKLTGKKAPARKASTAKKGNGASKPATRKASSAKKGTTAKKPAARKTTAKRSTSASSAS